MVRHYFTKPHDGDGAGCECKRHKDNIKHAARVYPESLQPAGHTYCLYKREDDRSVTCPLNDLFASLFSLFLHLLNARHDNREQLHDDA